MSEHCVDLSWERLSADFHYKNYNRTHQVSFGAGKSLEVSAAAEFLGDPEMADPEQCLLAALSSCHLLTFLAVCAKSRIVVDSYSDSAVAYLEPHASTQKLWVARVELNPKIVFHGETPSTEKLKKLHDLSHKNCFIANSVKSEIKVNLR